jgi:hypothetical protein
MSIRMKPVRFSSKLPRRYAASTLLGRLCANACTHTSRGKPLPAASAHQSRTVKRKPWIVMSPRPMRRRTAVKLMSDNTVREYGRGRRKRYRVASAGRLRWPPSTTEPDAFPAFMRLAGTAHSLASISISDHVTPRTSPDRHAVRIANCTARAASGGMNAAISWQGTAG